MRKFRKAGSNEEEEEVRSAPEQPDLSEIQEAIDAIVESSVEETLRQGAIEYFEGERERAEAIAEKEDIQKFANQVVKMYDLSWRNEGCNAVLSGHMIEMARPSLEVLNQKVKAWVAKWPQYADCIC